MRDQWNLSVDQGGNIVGGHLGRMPADDLKEDKPDEINHETNFDIKYSLVFDGGRLNIHINFNLSLSRDIVNP